MEYDVETILRRHGAMETERSLFEAHWLEVAERLLPRQADFLGANAAQGAKRTGRIFDEYAMLALSHHTAACEGFLIPRGSFYQSLVADDDELMKIKRVAEWYDDKTKLLFRRRYAPKSGFASQIHESFDSLGAFGNQALWVDGLRGPDGRPSGLFYRSVHIGEVYVRTSFQGRVDLVHRKFTLEARQALQMWPDNPPECAARAHAKGNDGDRHEYLHVLFPREDHDPERLDGRGMPIGSKYIAVEGKQELEEGGYRRMPLIYSRYETSPREDYGRGPGMKVLPAVKACQAMMQSLVRAVQLGCEPPLGGPDEDMIATLDYKPRGFTANAVNERGQKLIQTLFEGADTASAQELLKLTYERIDEAFLKHLFDVNEELKSHVSASAIMQRAGEKGVLLSPIMGRQETELLDPMTEREIDVMADLGDFDDMPPEVREAGGAFKTRYDNPLSRMARMEQAAGFFRTFEAAAPVLPVRPDILDNFDLDEAIRGVAEIQAVPPKWMTDPAKLDAIRKGRADQEALKTAVDAAPGVAGAIKDVSQAQAAGGTGGV